MRHLLIPDTQVGPGVPLDHFKWIGKAIARGRLVKPRNWYET